MDYNRPNYFGQEGLDHINISSRSDCHLGRVLDPSYYLVTNYPHLGRFSSVLNLWYWLKSDPLDDRLRKLSGKKLRQVMLHSTSSVQVTHFKAIIATATYAKLLQYPALVEQLKSLPTHVSILSYYYPGGCAVRLCSGYAKVMVEIVDVIRQALVNGVEPDFTSLATRGCSCKLSFLSPFIRERFGDARVQELLELTPQQ